MARGYNARAVEGPVTAGYERPTSQFGNNNEKRAGTKKEDAGERERERKKRGEGRRREEDVSSRCDKSRDMTFSAPRDKSYRTRETCIRREDLLEGTVCPEK